MSSDSTYLGQMVSAIESFDSGKIDLRSFLDVLECCVDELNDDDLPWKQAFRREWGRVEDAYAYASFRGMNAILERDVHAVEQALQEIRRLIKQKI